MLHFLGAFYFHWYRGTPALPYERIVAETRAGRDGHDLWALGAWADPFAFETRVAVLNYAAGLNLHRLYQLATASDPLPLMIGGVLIPGGRFQVLAVQSDVRACVRANVSGDSTHYQAVVSAQWTLLGIKDLA